MNKQFNELGGQVKERTLGYLTAAFGLIAGLAWNDAIKALIEVVFPLEKNTILAKFAYAVILTAVVVVVTVYLVRRFETKRQEEKGA